VSGNEGGITEKKHKRKMAGAARRRGGRSRNQSCNGYNKKRRDRSECGGPGGKKCTRLRKGEVFKEEVDCVFVRTMDLFALLPLRTVTLKKDTGSEGKRDKEGISNSEFDGGRGEER